MRHLPTALLLALACACSGGGSSEAPPAAPAPPTQPTPPPLPTATLREAYAGVFPVGAAVTSRQLDQADEADLLNRHFDMVVAEYEMKADQLAPAQGEYRWDAADAIVEYAQAMGLQVRGHALLWHQTTPAWFLEGGDRNTIRERLETYVAAVVGRYRGRIFAWDVVNEVVAAGDGTYRSSAWHRAVGPDYIAWAFRAARQADPECLLFINDYGTENAAKLDRLMTVVQALRDDGVPVDGVGHQFHLQRGASIDGVANALDTVAAAGLLNHVTELDISAYNDPGSCWADGSGCLPALTEDELPAFLSEQALLYRAVFNAARDRPSVEAVLTWGLHDGQSWLNSTPLPRINHPLLFDRNLASKPALYAVVDADYEP